MIISRTRNLSRTRAKRRSSLSHSQSRKQVYRAAQPPKVKSKWDFLLCIASRSEILTDMFILIGIFLWRQSLPSESPWVKRAWGWSAPRDWYQGCPYAQAEVASLDHFKSRANLIMISILIAACLLLGFSDRHMKGEIIIFSGTFIILLTGPTSTKHHLAKIIV